MNRPVLALQPLSPEAFAPYGSALGFGSPSAVASGESDRYASPASDFWRERLFDPGIGGATDVLWVVYRSAEAEVRRLEKHLLTQQALMPLDGEVVQVVARAGSDGLPDTATLAAFLVPPGQGLCMAPHCWHATRVRTPAEVRCAMLSRDSTTQDLVRALHTNGVPTESAYAVIPTHRWRA